MYVMGGGRVAPNPSNEVDIYNPGTNSWSLGTPFVTGRRNFPVDSDGCHIWLAGGYDSTGVPIASMEIFCCGGAPSPTPTATPQVHRQRRRPARQAVRPGHGALPRRTRYPTCATALRRPPLTSMCSAECPMARECPTLTAWTLPPECGNRARRCHLAVKRLRVP